MNLPLETMANVGAAFILFLFWLVVFAIFYHLARFGVGLLPKRLAALLLIGAVTLFSLTLFFFIKLDLSVLSTISL